MGFSSSKNYKTDKYGNVYNSTKSFQVFASQADKRFYEAWSYSEKIAIIDNNKGIVWFNSTNFSVTTSKHFYMLHKILNELPYFKYKKLYLEINSLNGYDSKTINKVLDDRSLKYNESLFQAVELGLLKGKRKLKEIEKRDKEKRDKNKLDEKKNRLKENIGRLNYKTESGLKKALKDFSELSEYKIDFYVNFLTASLTFLSNFKKFYPILKDSKSIILNFRLAYKSNNFWDCLSDNFRLDLIKEFKNELYINEKKYYRIKFWIYDDTIKNADKGQKDFFIYLYLNNYLVNESEDIDKAYKAFTADEIFSTLGD
jgi:hypothetical protein